jgi:Peptidase family S64
LIEDHRRTIEGFDGDPKKNEPPRFSLRLKVEMGETSKIPRLNNQEEKKKALEQESEKMRDFDRDIGSIYAGSGYRTASYQVYGTNHQHWGLDWALIELSARQMDNMIQATVQDIGCPFPAGLLANTWGGAELITKVAKKGRTTGWTVGGLNAITTVIVAPQYGREVTCLAVQGEKGSFADPGDSGAVVLEVPEGQWPRELKWVGLLFAAAEANNFGYVLPIDLVMRDIKEVTGCDVVEPVAL